MISYADEGSNHPKHDVVCIFTDGGIHDGQSSASSVIGLLRNDGTNEPYLDKIEIFSKYHNNSTNNIAELSAILFGIEKAFERYKSSEDHTYAYLIFSDSEYAIHTLTEWVFGWYKTYTCEKRNGIVVPYMLTKCGTPVKNCEIISAIIGMIVHHEEWFTFLQFVNVKGHTWKKGGIEEQMTYYKKANQTDITRKEAVFVTKYNHIVDRVASNVCDWVQNEGFDINFNDNGDPCMQFTVKGLNFKVYDSAGDGVRYSDYMILSSAIMRRYREILNQTPF